MKKKFFSIVLAVLMVVSMVPMAVFTASAECAHENIVYGMITIYTHTGYCLDCPYGEDKVPHVFVDGVCACGAIECAHENKYYADNGDGYSHYVVCFDCSRDSMQDPHVYVDGVCACGAEEPEPKEPGCMHENLSILPENIDENGHRYTCDDCLETFDVEGHVYYSPCICYICGYEYVCQHTWDLYDWDEVALPGKHITICSSCGSSYPELHSLVYTEIDSATHRYGCNKCGFGTEEPHEFENGVCTKCHAKQLKVTHSLVLADKIGTKIYVNMDEVNADGVMFNYNTDNTGYTKSFENMIVTKDEMTAEGDGRYSYTIWQAPAQIAEDITIQVLDGGCAPIGEIKTVNGRSYADAIMAGSYSQELKDVCEAMVLYAYECQKTFSGAYDITGVDLTGYDAGKLADVTFDSTKAVQVVSGDASKLHGITFMALSDSAVRVYAKKGMTVTATECGTNGDLMYAQLSGISAVDFDTMQTLTMTVDGAEIVLNICPLSYAVAAKNDIARSMVLYSTATDAFVASL